MQEQELDNLINNFDTEVDKNLEFQHDINLFGNELAAKLLTELDKEGVLANFYDTNFSFKFLSKPNNWNKLIFAIKMLDLDNYKRCLKLGIPESSKIKTATFEHDGTYKLQDEISKVIVLLLFDYYQIPLGAEELHDEEEETVHIRQK